MFLGTQSCLGLFALLCNLPYRIDTTSAPPDAVDTLIELGALDVDRVPEGLAAILPDSVTRDAVTNALGSASISFSEAVARDSGSVWLLKPRDIRIGGVLIASSEGEALSEALRLTDSNAFGTGHHPTTVLCIEAIEEILSNGHLDSVLDVGTGSGVLALAALMMGVPQAVGLDIDSDALQVAAENARLNNLADRLQLMLGGPHLVNGNWPLVVANILAAPLIDMASVLVQRVRSGGWLVLSGIPWSLASEVRQAYQHFGMRYIGSKTRDGWAVVTAQASW